MDILDNASPVAFNSHERKNFLGSFLLAVMCMVEYTVTQENSMKENVQDAFGAW